MYNGNLTIAQPNYVKFSIDFFLKKNKGEKSNRTLNPQGAHKFYCAKLNGLVDLSLKEKIHKAHIELDNIWYREFERRKRKRELEERLSFFQPALSLETIENLGKNKEKQSTFFNTFLITILFIFALFLYGGLYSVYLN